MRRAQGGMAALCAVFAIAVVISTETGQAADDFKLEDGYTSLFNGKDLTGWRWPGAKGVVLDDKTETPDKRIQVVNGIIVVNEKDDKGKGGIKDLYTVREFAKPFHLKLQFRAGLKADSGVYIRGPQLQVRDFPRFGGEFSKVPGFKLDDWNDLYITVTPPSSKTTVNGQTLTDKDVFELSFKDGKPAAKLNGKDITVTAYQYQAQVCYAVCKNNGELLTKTMAVPLKGGIGLQAESGKFEYRRIRVKEMD